MLELSVSTFHTEHTEQSMGGRGGTDFDEQCANGFCYIADTTSEVEEIAKPSSCTHSLLVPYAQNSKASKSERYIIAKKKKKNMGKKKRDAQQKDGCLIPQGQGAGNQTWLTHGGDGEWTDHYRIQTSVSCGTADGETRIGHKPFLKYLTCAPTVFLVSDRLNRSVNPFRAQLTQN